MDDLFIMSLPFRLELLLPDESSASAARWPLRGTAVLLAAGSTIQVVVLPGLDRSVPF